MAHMYFCTSAGSFLTTLSVTTTTIRWTAAEVLGGDPALGDPLERSRDLGQARGRLREGGYRRAHGVIVVVRDHEGLLAAFRGAGAGVP